MTTLEKLRQDAAAASANLAAMQSALREAEAAERAALDANDPTDPSPKALAPLESARARVASAKHHLEKARAREFSATAALGVELRRLARAEFDDVADRFGMRGWEKGNEARLAAYRRARSEAQRLLREMIGDVDRWNATADEMFDTARRTGHSDIPEWASAGAIADLLRSEVPSPPLEVLGATGVYLQSDMPEHKNAIGWGRKLLERVQERATAHLPDGSEIEPSEFFAMMDRTLAQCRPARTRTGTTTHVPFLLGEQEWLAAQAALGAWRQEFFSPGKVMEIRDRAGQRVEGRRMLVTRKAG
jgi:hypothetical protein